MGCMLVNSSKLKNVDRSLIDDCFPKNDDTAAIPATFELSDFISNVEKI